MAKYKIGDICDSISESYYRKDNEVILINTSDVYDGKILNHVSVENKNLRGQFKKTFIHNDILYSEIRPVNRRFAFVSIENTDNYIASTKLMVIRANNKILPKYLYYYLSSEQVITKLQILAESRSGTFPQITFGSELSKLDIEVPPIEEQATIVKFIESIDMKMELNDSINKNL